VNTTAEKLIVENPLSDEMWLFLEIIGVLILVFGVYGFMVYVKLSQFREQVRGDIHPLIKKFNPRYKLVTDLLACIKDNNISEPVAVAAVVNTRSKASKSATPQEHIEWENQFTVALLRLLVILKKKYPELKNDLWYLDIVEKFKVFTADIDEEGQSYNVIVRSYNDLIKHWSSKFLAKKLKHEVVPTYLAWEDAKLKLAKKELPSEKEIRKREQDIWAAKRKRINANEKAEKQKMKAHEKEDKLKEKERKQQEKEREKEKKRNK